MSEKTREQLETEARDAVHRFLGNPSGQAADMVRDLTDDELRTIEAAVRFDNGTYRPADVVRPAIKDVFMAAYERKRKEHELQASADFQATNRRAAAVRVLIAHGCPDGQARDIIGRLNESEQTALASFEGATDAIDVVEAVIRRAQSRAEETVKVEGGELASVTTVSTADGTLAADYLVPGQVVPVGEDGTLESSASDQLAEPAAPEPTSEPPAAEPAAEAPAAEPAAPKPVAKPKAPKKP